MDINLILKGATNKVASFFVKIYERTHECLLNTFVAKADEYYSYDEPLPEKMKNKTFWIQILRKEKEDE